jgi:hypothetical protein
MFEGLNKTLTESIRGMQVVQKSVADDIKELYANKAYTDDYKNTESRKILDDARAKMERKKEEGVAAIAAKIDSLNSDERREAELRAVDTDYLKRLDMKLDTIGRIMSKSISPNGETIITSPKLSDDVLRAYFSEFEDDPIAIMTIKEKLGVHAIAIAPADNTGKRQEHLKKVQVVFEKVMNHSVKHTNTVMSEVSKSVALHSLYDTEINYGEFIVQAANATGFEVEEENAFCLYCNKQNGDFSLNDADLFAEMITENPVLKMAIESIKWRMS